MRIHIYKSAKKLAFAISTCSMSVAALAASTGNLATLSDTEAANAALVAFTQCDQSFFTALALKPQSFGFGVAVSTAGNVASPTVTDPLSDKGRVQTFEKPVEVGGLKLLAYRNEVSYDVNMGAFLWWGFDVEGTVNSVAQAANQLLKPEQKLIKEGGMWARSEYRRVGDPLDSWRRGGQGNGTVTEKGVVERVLIVEEHDIKGRTKLYCTLQGSVTPPLLQRVRPDLPVSAQP